MTKSR